MTGWGKRDDMLVHQAAPFNAEPAGAALVGRPITPTESFYTRNHGPIPSIDPSSWRLRVDGLVDRELTLSLDELRDRFAPHTEVVTLQCAGNRRAGLLAVRHIPGEHAWGSGAISTAVWTGVRLADVLAAARVQPDARHLELTAPDVSDSADPPQPFGGSIPVTKAVCGEVLLAWSMNDKPLPAVHGGPVRVVVPGYIGARSVKWISRVSALRQPSDNYFQAVAYRLLPADVAPAPGRGLSLGPTALTADILAPADGARLPAGRTEVSGYALAAPHRTVVRVDVSLDGGATWQQATVDAAASPWAWQLWHATVELDRGPAHLAARAWDDTAATQPESAASVWNPKGYANTSWARVYVTAE